MNTGAPTEQVKETNAPRDNSGNQLTPDKCSLLVVEPDITLRNNLVQMLKDLGFQYVSETDSHDTGLRRCAGKSFTHAIFSTVSTNIHYHDFLRSLVANNPETIAMPMSKNPNPDQVYEAIMLGARGFVVFPCEKDDLKQLFDLSAREELALAVELQDLDRNKVLVSLLSTGLDDLAEALRKARTKKSKEINILNENFKSSVKMARSFCKGGEEELLKVIEDHMIKQSFKNPTRLGKIRRQIAARRRLDARKKKE